MANIIKIIDGTPRVIEDRWVIVREAETADSQLTTQKILPFSRWNDLDPHDASAKPRAIWISPDDDFESRTVQLGELDLIAVDFPSFRDGRGYSIGYLLRTRYRWKGELRAIGDVLRDQLNYMRRCGFDTFAVRADKNIDDALKSFSRYTVQYQGAVDQPLPLFQRR